MAGEWRECALGDVIELKRGYDLPQQNRRAGSVPLVSSSGVTDFHEEAAVKGPGVVTGRYGTLGQVFFIRDDFWPLNTTLYVRDFKANDPRFISYFLRGLDFLAYSDKAAVPGLNRNHLHQARVRIPSDTSEQRAIAHVLGTLDDKIELNRRMGETLEGIARAIFKSWFVDFDPVRAKAKGRDPGLPNHLADLFPDRLAASELGDIPDGWEVRRLGEMIETIKGCSYRSDELVPSDTALVTLKSFARGGGYRPDGLKSFSGSYKPDQVVQPGELVIAGTDVTQAAEVIGRPAIVRGTNGYRTLVASLDTLIVRPRRSGMTRAFLYFLCGTEAFVAHTYAYTTGTTVLHLAKEAVPSYSFAWPLGGLVDQFDSLASSALDRIQALENESANLAALRDTLLPKLISGELRIKDVEPVAEEKVS
ncbi:MAG: restriction endonuclease subunit S [bacterium]